MKVMVLLRGLRLKILQIEFLNCIRFYPTVKKYLWKVSRPKAKKKNEKQEQQIKTREK